MFSNRNLTVMAVSLFLMLSVHAQTDYLYSLTKSDARITNLDIHIEFDLHNSDTQVQVIEKATETYKSLAGRADIYRAITYDSFSSVEDVDVDAERNRYIAKEITDKAYQSNSIFHHDFRFKAVYVGLKTANTEATIEYERITDDIRFFPTLYFSKSYPIENFKVTVSVPEWLNMEIMPFYLEEYGIKHHTETDGDVIHHIYEGNSLRGFKNSRFTLGPSYYQPHLLLLPKSYNDDGVNINILDKTADLYSWYRQIVDEVQYPNDAFAKAIPEIVGDATSDQEIIERLYYWVQDNIQYIAFEDGLAGFRPDSPVNVYEKRFGDCKGMAVLTKALLVTAGYDARLAWIGTDRIAYDYSTPSLAVDNHMICALNIDGEWVFLDGTEKFNKMGEYADRIKGKQAMIENGDDYILVKVPDTGDATETVIRNVSLQNESLIGNASMELTGDARVQTQYQLQSIQKDKQQELMNFLAQRIMPDYEINDIRLENTFKRDTLKLNFSFTNENVLTSFGDMAYLDISSWIPEHYKMYDEDFKLPMLMPYSKDVTHRSKIALNQYTSNSLPEPLLIENDLYSIKTEYAMQDGTLIVLDKFKIKERSFTAEEVSQWNEDIKLIQEYYKEQITLDTKQ